MVELSLVVVLRYRGSARWQVLKHSFYFCYYDLGYALFLCLKNIKFLVLQFGLYFFHCRVCLFCLLVVE